MGRARPSWPAGGRPEALDEAEVPREHGALGERWWAASGEVPAVAPEGCGGLEGQGAGLLPPDDEGRLLGAGVQSAWHHVPPLGEGDLRFAATVSLID